MHVDYIIDDKYKSTQTNPRKFAAHFFVWQRIFLLGTVTSTCIYLANNIRINQLLLSHLPPRHCVTAKLEQGTGREMTRAV